MINNIKQAIGKALADSYPNLTIYDEDVPQKFKTPSFIINVVDMAYQKRLNQKYDGKITFDVAYFSDKKITIENIVDPAIIGGFILRIGDKQYNASVYNRLQVLKREFSN